MTGLLTRSTIVVVTWRGKDHVGACLDAVAAQTRPHRLLVIDNASDDGTAEVLARHPSAPSVLRLPVNAGYAGALAAVDVDTEFTAWLNDDAEPAPDWLARLEDALDQHEDAAAAGSRMVARDGAVISLGVGLTPDGHGADLVSPNTPPFGFCGGAVLLRTQALRAVGGVPARFFCYYEDTDTAWRLRLAGHTIVSVPEARVTHRHGASTRPGSRQFHLWNERNRLAMLVRCAPTRVATRELAKFVALTVLLALRQLPLRQPRHRKPSLRKLSTRYLSARRLSRGRLFTGHASAGTGSDGHGHIGDGSAGKHVPADETPEGRLPGKPVSPARVSGAAVPEGESSGEQVPEGHASRGQGSVGKVSAERISEGQVSGEQVSGTPISGGQVSEGLVSEGQESERLVSGGQVSAGFVSAGQVSGGRAPGRLGSEGRVAGVRMSGASTSDAPDGEARVPGGAPSPPWNFRVGLRVQVIREVAVTLRLLLRERRTITRGANVPRSVVWRWATSANSPS